MVRVVPCGPPWGNVIQGGMSSESRGLDDLITIVSAGERPGIGMTEAVRLDKISCTLFSDQYHKTKRANSKSIPTIRRKERLVNDSPLDFFQSVHFTQK